MRKILIVCPNPNDGTSYYRGIPYLRIGGEIRKSNSQWLDWVELYNVDLVVFQRPVTQVDVLNIETVKACGIPVICDWDDDPSTVMPDNPAHEFYDRESIQACVRTIAKLADAVTVTTEGLKKAILKLQPEANVTIIPNAIDDDLFDLTPSNHKRNKIILLRGASSHTNDWLEYKEAIKLILTKFPDYTLAVMGFHPPWLGELPSKQLKAYKFTTIEAYFQTLLQIRPELMIVPLLQNEFNNSKSAIALYEGALAGAAVTSADLDEFRNFNAIVFTPENFVDIVTGIITRGERYIQTQYTRQLKSVPKLTEVNESRRDIIETLISNKRKLGPNESPNPQPATDQEFLEYSLSHGHTQDFPPYQEAHSKAAKWLIDTLKPKTVLELGCGTGATLVEFLRAGVVGYGIEYNPKSYDYFINHYPMFQNQVTLADLTKEPIEVDEPGDLLMSIEVFEHIDKPEKWWEEFLTDLSKKFKHFYFSSTPFSDTYYFDAWWGHCNVRRGSDWIRLFEKCGWKYSTNPRLLTSWDMIFDSVTLTNKQR